MHALSGIKFELLKQVVCISRSVNGRVLTTVAVYFFSGPKGSDRCTVAPPIGLKWHVIGTGDLIGVFARPLGAIELANGFCTNEPGPNGFSFPGSSSSCLQL